MQASGLVFEGDIYAANAGGSFIGVIHTLTVALKGLQIRPVSDKARRKSLHFRVFAGEQLELHSNARSLDLAAAKRPGRRRRRPASEFGVSPKRKQKSHASSDCRYRYHVNS